MQQLDFTFLPSPKDARSSKPRVLKKAPAKSSGKSPNPDAQRIKHLLKQKLVQEPTGRSRRRMLQQNIAKHVEGPLQVEMHDNRRVMISSRRRKGVLIIRLHHMFLQADDRTIRALARFASKADSWSKNVVNDYIESHNHLITAEPKKRLDQNNTYKYHNLTNIFQELNEDYFKQKVQAEIGYGQAGNPKGRRRRSILLGSYDSSARRITIHPALDQAKVPRVYVAYVVFHEMLHQVFPSRREAGRTIMHGPDFRRAERAFAGRREALLWFKKNEDTVLKFRPGR